MRKKQAPPLTLDRRGRDTPSMIHPHRWKQDNSRLKWSVQNIYMFTFLNLFLLHFHKCTLVVRSIWYWCLYTLYSTVIGLYLLSNAFSHIFFISNHLTFRHSRNRWAPQLHLNLLQDHTENLTFQGFPCQVSQPTRGDLTFQGFPCQVSQPTRGDLTFQGFPCQVKGF